MILLQRAQTWNILFRRSNYQMREIERKRVAGVKGRLRVKVSREMLMSWVENFIDDFNDKKTAGVTNIIFPCLTKVGQNCFVDDT